MINRYQLTVYIDFKKIYCSSFSSINHLVKFACGFHETCILDAYDCVFDKSLPISDLVDEFKGECYGI